LRIDVKVFNFMLTAAERCGKDVCSGM